MHQCIKFIYFRILHVSDGLSVHHQKFKTVHTAKGICQTVNPEMGKITSECEHVYYNIYIYIYIHTHTHICVCVCLWGTAVAQWLRRCATNSKVAGSIPDGVIGIFH